MSQGGGSGGGRQLIGSILPYTYKYGCNVFLKLNLAFNIVGAFTLSPPNTHLVLPLDNAIAQGVISVCPGAHCAHPYGFP